MVRRLLFFGWNPRDDFYLEVLRLHEIGNKYGAFLDEAAFLKAQGLGDGKFDWSRYRQSLKDSLGEDYDHLCGHTLLSRLVIGNLKYLNRKRVSVEDDNWRDDLWEERTITSLDENELLTIVNPHTYLFALREELELASNNVNEQGSTNEPSLKNIHTKKDLQDIVKGEHVQGAIETVQLLGGAYLVIALFNLGLLSEDEPKTIDGISKQLGINKRQYYHILGECIRYLSGWSYVGPAGPRRGKVGVGSLAPLRKEASFVLSATNQLHLVKVDA